MYGPPRAVSYRKKGSRSGSSNGLVPRRLRERYEQVLKARVSSGGANIDALRKLVLLEGLPEESDVEIKTCSTKCTLRGRVWKVLLGLDNVDAAEYLSLVAKGPSNHEEKIDKDLHRTLASDTDFTSRVTQSKLCRLLNAYSNGKLKASKLSHKGRARRPSADAGTSHSGVYYVQGMNLIAAPFLFVMTEVDAYFSFYRFLTHNCPRYVSSNLAGVHDGHVLADMVLKACDKELHEQLAQQQLTSEMTLFPTILSFSTNRKPLGQVLRLWDIMIAYGAHLNIVFAVANLILVRNIILMNSPAQNQKLINTGVGMPPLKASLLITLSMHLLNRLPGDLYAQLVLHPYKVLDNENAIVNEPVPTAIDLLS